MPRRTRPLFALALCAGLLTASCTGSRSMGPAPGTASGVVSAGSVDDAWLRRHYQKQEFLVPMRDGERLHTVVYSPVNSSAEYPILLVRTPYSAGPYGAESFKSSLHHNEGMLREGYIFAFQDVRGRYLSEGEFVNMTPHVADKMSVQDVDESSDCFDTIEFLLDHVENNNGRVGMWGISYPGFYAAASMIDAHPALVAVSPQAPIADWYFDDFHHHGAFFLPHTFRFFSAFGLPRPEPTEERSDRPFEFPGVDGYDFYLNTAPTVSELNGPDYLNGQSEFFNAAIEHPDYDEFWQSRNIVPHLRHVAPHVLVVGGWFDAEDLYGPLAIYRSIEQKNPGSDNRLVMGPWRHGGWGRDDGSRLGNVHFGERTSIFYRSYIEKPFFDEHLKGIGRADLPEAFMFETGTNEWRRFEEWPPHVTRRTLFARSGGALGFEQPRVDDGAFDEFISDPGKPVPFTQDIALGMTREYMTDDQRFASRRPDVLVYQTEPLEDDLTIAGPVLARMWVSTTATDADWIVKLIDVHPSDHEDYLGIARGMKTGGYQMMVRSEVIRGRYRNSYERPEPFEPNEPTRVNLALQDVLHTFKKDHRIMIHVQSTWFPLVDRNPQNYVENIFHASEHDHTRAIHRVYRSETYPTRFDVGVLGADLGDDR